MARIQITQEIIEEINKLYLEIGTYAGVSRAMGGTPSATTVKKYIIPNYKPRERLQIKKFEVEISSLPNYEPFKLVDNWGELCVLSESEEAEIHELWEELSL